MKPLTPPNPIDPEDLYIYSLRKMAESNMKENRTNLTNLLNLRAFLYKADDLIRYSDDKYAIIVLDIAGFKLVNEFCSRKDGDALLRHISDCLRSYENEKTAAAHLRADIFALCISYEEESELVAVVNDLSERIRNFPISCKILPAFGICTAQDKQVSASNMQDYAFIAQKTIKGKYFTNYAFFDNAMREKMLLEKKIENGFDEAMITDQFQLYIQPKVDMTDGHIVGGEALVRWIHPAEGLIPPDSFIPVLEKNTSVIDMDKIIWKKVFALLSELKHDYNIELPVSINISRLHSHDDSFVDILKEFSDKFQISPSLVPLELTESAYSGSEIMYRKISSLKQYGFLFSMDDFGSGYSTMNMLGSQPVDEIKIDKVFLNHIEDPKSQIIIHHSIDMFHALGLKIVVEGVETEFQRKLLLEWGCRYAQGYLFYKPMPAQNFKELVIREKN